MEFKKPELVVAIMTLNHCFDKSLNDIYSLIPNLGYETTHEEIASLFRTHRAQQNFLGRLIPATLLSMDIKADKKLKHYREFEKLKHVNIPTVILNDYQENQWYEFYTGAIVCSEHSMYNGTVIKLGKLEDHKTGF